MPDPSWSVLVGDCREVLATLPERSAQTVVTSPPYFGLRDYGADGQIGLEPTPVEFVEALVAVFREVRRVLRDDGTVWLNLGDSYAAQGGAHGGRENNQRGVGAKRTHDARAGDQAARRPPSGVKQKDLLGIPWLVAFALRADGWYLRSDIVWHKPNPMPESVTDRPTRAHEFIFLLSKGPRYFYDADAIREQSDPAQTAHNLRYARPYDNADRIAAGQPGNVNNVGIHSRPGRPEGGRNKRDVWTVTSKPYSGAHFATFPPDLIKPCVLAGAPEGGVVLDPFNGAGTTGLVAVRNRRAYIGVELNPEYAEMARDRIATDVRLGHRPAAKGTLLDGQASLFD